MALKKTIIWKTFEVVGSYKSIKDFEAVRDGEEFKVQVHTNVYKNSDKKTCLYGENCTVTVPYGDGSVTLAQLYTEIKKDELNEGWVDC